MKNGWGEYKKLFLHELEENGKRFEKIEQHFQVIDQKFEGLDKAVSGLKIKTAIIWMIIGVVGTNAASTILSAIR